MKKVITAMYRDRRDSGDALSTKVVSQLLNGVDAWVLGPVPALPLLYGEIWDASLLGDHTEGLVARFELAQHEVKQGFLSHDPNLAIFDYWRKPYLAKKPQMANHSCYGSSMPIESKPSARKILAENIRTLVKLAGSQPALVKLTRVPQKTISRAVNDENAANLDTLNDLARGMGIEPWQLLVPNLDLTDPPVILQRSVLEEFFPVLDAAIEKKQAKYGNPYDDFLLKAEIKRRKAEARFGDEIDVIEALRKSADHPAKKNEPAAKDRGTKRIRKGV